MDDLSLHKAIRNPVRLRRSRFSELDRIITVACASNSVVDLQIHSSVESDLDIYRRVDGIGHPGMITWLSAVLKEDEQICEVIVRSLWNGDHREIQESSIMVWSSFTIMSITNKDS